MLKLILSVGFAVSLYCLCPTEIMSQTDRKPAKRHGRGNSDPFPEFKGCVKMVLPPTFDIGVIEQKVLYRWIMADRGGCGSITLRTGPSVSQMLDTQRAYSDPFTRRFKLKGYEAWRNSPRCNTPPSPGPEIGVYTAPDEAFIVEEENDASRSRILAFAYKANFRKFSRYIRSLKTMSGGE